MPVARRAVPESPIMKTRSRLGTGHAVVVAMVIGVTVGYLAPDQRPGVFHASDLEVVSSVFLRMIKSLVAPLVFSTLVVGIAGHGDDLSRVGRLAVRSAIYFELATTAALVVG